MSEPSKANRPPVTDGPNPMSRRVGGLFVGCLLAIFLLWILISVISAVIGLTTGYLYLLPARGGDAIELYGVWARVVSVMILLFYGSILVLVFRQTRKRRRPKILGDSDSH